MRTWTRRRRPRIWKTQDSEKNIEKKLSKKEHFQENFRRQRNKQSPGELKESEIQEHPHRNSERNMNCITPIIGNGVVRVYEAEA